MRPTNISVLSQPSVETKIRQLTLVLSAVPDMEISCTDSAECFDENKAYLMGRAEEEKNEKVRSLIKRDVTFLDEIRLLALYFDASMYGEQMPDSDGEQFFDIVSAEKER